MPHSEPRKYAIIGAGALGAYYGALLQRAGLPVHFLFNSDFAHVRSRGLRIDSKYGNFHLPKVHAYDDPRQMPPCDVVILALKTTQNHLLPTFLPPVTAPDGLVLVLQNGLGMEEMAAAVVGPRRVMGGLCFLCSNRIGPGHIHHLDYGPITLGDFTPDQTPAGITPRMAAIGEDFTRAGVKITLSEDLLLARWQKLVWNVPFNGLSVALDTTTDRIVGLPATRKLAADLMLEVAAGAAACGRTLDPEFLEKMMTNTDQMVAYRPSMKLDFDAGRPMELQAMYANPILAAAARGVQLPRMTMLLQQLQFMEARQSGNLK